MDVWDYFDRFQREFEHRSLVATEHFSMVELAGSNGTRGRIFGNLLFELEEVDAFLRVGEIVEIRGNHGVRTEYGYFLIIDSVEWGGWERDLSHEPAVHRHIKQHERVEADEISFATALDFAWHDVSTYLEDREAIPE